MIVESFIARVLPRSLSLCCQFSSPLWFTVVTLAGVFLEKRKPQCSCPEKSFVCYFFGFLPFCFWFRGDFSAFLRQWESDEDAGELHPETADLWDDALNYILMRPPSSSNQINRKCTHEKEPERHPDGWVHHRRGVPWSSGIALKWESNCQVETTHRYGWRASSKTNHCADKRTESHSEWCQRQTCWVINCILMGLMKTKVREGKKKQVKVC